MYVLHMNTKVATRTCSSDPTYRDNTLIYTSTVRSKKALYNPLPTPGLRREAPERSSDPSEVAVGAP